ncbi:branched-chain amino acid ABC transporter permease [Sinirhodobacter populi]|uniref:Branched-chain amino acid ABC transporter permease n=1 Tax=Paenirhodobacter populi TaxID=2306993 RepID=A0A443KGN0_9RHOB|nr:AzlC family ABC transporter permease [Sinirhodobacter populi]RWR31896.1 branched-chain amino acid ABC transporter permease [Sinirhodobacter populi]
MPDDMYKPAAFSPGEFRRGLGDITPLSLGVAVYGLAFGLLAAGQGMGPMTTGLMGALVFAGSSQIVAVERLAADAGAMLAVVAGLALNLRILLMTASLRGELSGRPLWQVLLGVHLTSDENWVLMHATRNKGQPAGYWYLVGGGISLIVVWVVSTALGAAFARSLPDLAASGMGFAFTAAFILLLTSLWKGRQSLPPWVVSAVIAAGCAWLLPLDPSWGLIAGAVAGAGFAGMQRHG